MKKSLMRLIFSFFVLSNKRSVDLQTKVKHRNRWQQQDENDNDDEEELDDAFDIDLNVFNFEEDNQ